MNPARATIRPMIRPEIDLAVDWAAAEGWNPGLADAACFRAQDPTGFLVGRIGDEAVAVISAVKYGASFGFIGFYIYHEASATITAGGTVDPGFN